MYYRSVDQPQLWAPNFRHRHLGHVLEETQSLAHWLIFSFAKEYDFLSCFQHRIVLIWITRNRIFPFRPQEIIIRPLHLDFLVRLEGKGM